MSSEHETLDPDLLGVGGWVPLAGLVSQKGRLRAR